MMGGFTQLQSMSLALYAHRELLFAWTMRIIRGRYKQSLLGGLWAIIQPVARAGLFTIIFTVFIPIDTGNTPYAVFSYTALLPWMLFSASIVDMVNSLIGNMSLVSKIYFPREILPVSALLARFLDFGIAFGILLLMMIYYQMPFTIYWLYLPLILLVLLALSLGVGFIGATLNVFYRDVQHLVEFGMQLWLYASPIIYPVTKVPAHLRTIYFLNPMAGVIEAFRSVLLHQQSPDSSLVTAAIISAVVLIVGYWFFKRSEFQFADVV
jgi:lipopolysaccharide transport system permease protein